jgi:glucose/arabinose dehydrogenase
MRDRVVLALVVGIVFSMMPAMRGRVSAQEGPEMLVAGLDVRPVTSGLVTPTSLAFIGPNDVLVLEKNTGRVMRVTNGVKAGTALDLGVNFASERGLLGIALHPDFPADPGVYLFWSCPGTPPPADNPFFPVEQECADEPTLGADTGDTLATPMLGNRVDRFEWDATSGTLTFDFNLVKLLAFQNDGAPEPPGQGDDATGPHGQQPARANHDGGVIDFGPDGKLYVLFGDVGRRGQLQNLPCGPTATTCPGTVTPDDQFGGPEPDDEHFTGVVLRLNDDGSTPTDNPFFGVGASAVGEVGENLQTVFSYGIRNSFGMDFDPRSGALWTQENGEDAYDELNRVTPGQNSGWIQLAGPASRVADFKAIETTSLHHEDFPNLQQFRWGPERIADTPAEALSRMFVLPGSQYSDPEFSWKHVLAPAAIGFMNSSGLGPQYNGDLFVGFSVPEPLGGPLFHFNLTGNRRAIATDDPRLEDRVADNATFHDMTESESLLVGTGFGIVTDIEPSPDGTLYVVSLDQGTVHEVFRTR